MSNIFRLRPNVGVPLSNTTLPLHAKALKLPTYDRSTLSPGIVHVGVGGFHRAHQAWYTARARDASDWGIAAFTGRRPDMARSLAPQDGLYTLITRSADGDTFEVVGALERAMRRQRDMH